MSKSSVIAAAVVLVVAVGAVAGYKYMTPEETAPEVVAPPVVKVEQPSKGDIELFRSMTGTVEPSDDSKGSRRDYGCPCKNWRLCGRRAIIV